MAIPFLNNIDLNKYQALNWVRQLLTSDPSSPTEGQVYHNTTDHVQKFYNGTDWIQNGKLNQVTPPDGDVSFNGHKATNGADPASDQDFATKSYVDTLATGVSSWKQVVRAASTVNGTLATAFEDGDTMDGVTLATGDRILLKNQTTASENGPYTVNASGAPTRTTDADIGAEMVGAAMWVAEGTTNADTAWVCTTNAPITLGSTSLTFVQYSALGGITAGAGLTKTGATLDVGAGAGISVAADSVAVDRTTTPQFASGDCTNQASQDFTHNLNNQWCLCQVMAKASPYAEVIPEIRRKDANTVTIVFATAPAAADYRITCVG